jgi:AMMECR1 domain-containing protein
MKNGDHQGLLLPQVPVEEKWDRQTFLEQTCLKAGMRGGCWKDDDTDIFMFTAVVFGETTAADIIPGAVASPDSRVRPGVPGPGSPPQ